MEKPFLSVDETAKLLRTTKKSIYAKIHRKEFPKNTFRRFGRRVLFVKEELLKFVLSTDCPEKPEDYKRLINDAVSSMKETFEA